MADVFISYKRERRPAARHLEQILVRYGYSVWFDLALVRGADYEEQIQRELNAAKAVIVLWCGLSVLSGGVRSEASRAKAQGKLVPVVIEPCELPLFSTLEQNIDLRTAGCSPRDHALDLILDDLERLVGRAPVADLKALRDYEATWRSLAGGLPLAKLPLEQVAIVEVPVAGAMASPLASGAPVTGAAAEWQALGLDTSDDVGLLAAYAAKWQAIDPVWAYKASRASQAQEAAIRAAAEAHERAEAERRLAAWRAEGRIKVDARVLHGAPADPAGGGWFRPGAGKTEWFKDLDSGPAMVVVPAGSFMMGSPADEPERETVDKGREGQVPVTIAHPFAVGRCAVTRGEFAAFVQATGYSMPGPAAYGWTGREWKRGLKYSWRYPGFTQDDRHPVVCVNWDDAQAYVTWLREVTGKPYRLLSEAEWEYAARAGTTTPFWWGRSISTARANYNGGSTYAGGERGVSAEGTVPVDYAQKQFTANPWGLQQVHGNVWEWCADCWNGTNEGNPGDGSARTSGDCSVHVFRGGSWYNDPSALRAAVRFRIGSRNGDGGFRVGRSLLPPRTL